MVSETNISTYRGYYSAILTAWFYETETGNVYDNCSKNNKKFCFSNYSVKSKYGNNSNALAAGKIKY